MYRYCHCPVPSAQCPQCSRVCAILCRWRVRRGVVTTDQCADPAPAPPLPPTTARDLDAEWSCSAQSVTYPALGTIYTSSAPTLRHHQYLHSASSIFTPPPEEEEDAPLKNVHSRESARPLRFPEGEIMLQFHVPHLARQ